jgi:hypothetical protein
MAKSKRWHITKWIILALIVAAFSSLWQEIGSAMSGVMVQLGWCVKGDFLCILRNYAIIAVCLIMIGVVIDIIRRATAKQKTKVLSPKKFNAILSDRPHKCSFWGYSFSLMPKELEEGKAYMIRNPACPKCGNIDEVLRYYEG